MQIPSRLAVLLALFFKRVCISEAAALDIRNSSITINQDELLNGTLTAGVPTQFEAIWEPQRGGAFDRFDCVALAVKVLSGLALSDSSDHIVPQGCTMGPDMGGFTIAVNLHGIPLRTRGIQVRYVIWGIDEAVKVFIQTNTFKVSVFDLKWQGNAVGCLVLYNTPLLRIPSNDTLSIITQDVSSLSLLNGTLPALLGAPSFNVSTLAAPHFSIQFLRDDTHQAPLNPMKLFFIILALLLTAAEHPADQAIYQRFTATVDGSGVQALVTGPQTSKPMMRPPVFKYSWLCKGLKITSEFLITTRRFEEFLIKLRVDEVEIGNVLFQSTGRTAALIAEE